MGQGTVAEAEDLAAEIVEFSGSSESRLFYLKAIYDLGPGLVREAVGEVRYRVSTGEIRDKARYLTTVLLRWMKEGAATVEPAPPEPDSRLLGQETLPRLLGQKTGEKGDRLPAGDRAISKVLDVPFSRKHLQWVRELNNDFFTLTNEKADWDKIETTIEWAGQAVPVTMLRGKVTPEDDPNGIPTTEDMRVLLALEKIWAERRGPHEVGESSGLRLCTLDTTAGEVARQMGLSDGGYVMGYISKKILKLSRTGYCYVFPKGMTQNGVTYQNFGFKFLADAIPLTRTEYGRQVRYFRITFSEPFSRQLLARYVVSRPIDMLLVRGDIALKLYVHLFPILCSRKPSDPAYSVELLNLLPLLRMKKTGWWQYKSQRKREFEKALRELNGRPGKDGHMFDIRIEQGLNSKDFVLEARFVRNDAIPVGA